VAGTRVTAGGTERAPDVGYIGQIARSAEQLGFAAALTPTSSWCEDAWVQIGIDEFILSGYPHLEEAYQVGEGVMPVLRERGLLGSPRFARRTVIGSPDREVAR
jgi:alkanesulfonate monooxygenase SsuD/methylene tetrahydromethanopterin reductase-like flavin-dependent oxidoreductase (luciferase family)